MHQFLNVPRDSAQVSFLGFRGIRSEWGRKAEQEPVGGKKGLVRERTPEAWARERPGGCGKGARRGASWRASRSHVQEETFGACGTLANK